MSMDSFLAEIYGTKTASAEPQEDLEKEASVQLFMKLAGQEGIDLKSMADEDVAALFASWEEKVAAADAGATQKTASDDNDKDDEKKKREEAEKEHEEKKAAAEKVAEADALGRIMAHSFTDEYRKIAAAGGVPGIDPETVTAGEDKTAAMPEALRKGLEAARGHAGKAGKAIGDAAGKAKDKGKELAGKAGDAAKKHKGHAAAAAGGAAAGGAAGFMAGKKKQSSAIDELAAERAVLMAHEANFDAEQAGRKVASVRELELVGESEKVAHAPDLDTAVGIRALEFLEAAGYPVTWPEQQ